MYILCIANSQRGKKIKIKTQQQNFDPHRHSFSKTLHRHFFSVIRNKILKTKKEKHLKCYHSIGLNNFNKNIDLYYSVQRKGRGSCSGSGRTCSRF